MTLFSFLGLLAWLRSAEADNDQKRGFRWTATECEAASGSAASNENSRFSATMDKKSKLGNEDFNLD